MDLNASLARVSVGWFVLAVLLVIAGLVVVKYWRR
jgi:hypothetical protein